MKWDKKKGERKEKNIHVLETEGEENKENIITGLKRKRKEEKILTQIRQHWETGKKTKKRKEKNVHIRRREERNC